MAPSVNIGITAVIVDYSKYLHVDKFWHFYDGGDSLFMVWRQPHGQSWNWWRTKPQSPMAKIHKASFNNSWSKSSKSSLFMFLPQWVSGSVNTEGMWENIASLWSSSPQWPYFLPSPWSSIMSNLTAKQFYVYKNFICEERVDAFTVNEKENENKLFITNVSYVKLFSVLFFPMRFCIILQNLK